MVDKLKDPKCYKDIKIPELKYDNSSNFKRINTRVPLEDPYSSPSIGTTAQEAVYDPLGLQSLVQSTKTEPNLTPNEMLQRYARPTISVDEQGILIVKQPEVIEK